MSEQVSPSDQAELLAAEYALGLLDSVGVETAAQRERDDPAFAEMVARWRERAGEWIAALPEAEVDGRVWSRIQLALGHREAPPVSEIGMARDVSMPRRGWRAVALAAIAACLVMAVMLGVAMTGRQDAASSAPPPIARAERDTNVAQIADSQGAPLFSALYDAANGTMTMRVSDLQTSDKAPELWVLDEAGKPHSLGMIDKGGSITITLSDEVRHLLVDGAIMAITLENRDSAPHDAPTGKILGTAQLSKL